MELTKAPSLDSVKNLMTGIFLLKLGLRTVDNVRRAVPSYVYLTSEQKWWKAKAESYGYIVGLL